MGGRGGSKGGGGGGGPTAKELENLKIGGLNPTELKAAWKSTFGSELTSARQVHDLLGVTRDMLSGYFGGVSVSGRHGWLQISASGKDFSMTRTFRSGGTVTHDLLFLAEHAKGKGTGTAILKRATRSYVQLGVKKIDLHAAEDGRYVWPKMGFRTSPAMVAKYSAGFTKFLEGQGIAAPKRIYSVNQIARTEFRGRQVGKEYLLSKSAPNLTHFRVRTARLAKYLSDK